MIIAGIDPGTGRTGWGIISVEKQKRRPLLTCIKYGCIETPKDRSNAERLVVLERELKGILQKYKPKFVGVEQLFFGINTRTAMVVGQARGVILLTIAALHLELAEYQGLSVKRIVTGSGRAQKRDVQLKVQTILRLKEKPRPDDAADGLAIAITHAVKTGLIEL